MRRPGSRPARQRGAALFFALIILGLMTILALSAYSTGSVNLKVLSNVQARQEATAAADQAAQSVISSIAFFSAASPYTAALDVDVNNDAAADYSVSVTATCMTYRPYPAPGQTLDPGDVCQGSATLGSFCTQTLWDVRSHALPASGTSYRGNAGTDVTLHQGASVLLSVEKTNTVCN